MGEQVLKEGGILGSCVLCGETMQFHHLGKYKTKKQKGLGVNGESFTKNASKWKA